MMAVLTAITSCNQEPARQNPFLSEYATPFQVPPFNLIDSTDYLPAFNEGMHQQDAEIETIVSNPDAPTFENTILAFDKSGKTLQKVRLVFDNLEEANTNEQMQKIARELSPLITKHADNIYLNKRLFERIREVYDKRFESDLDPQQIRVTEKYFRDFERKGANLSEEDQAELRKINERLSMLSLTFGDHLLAETNENFLLIIEDRMDLEGLPQPIVDGASETAKEHGYDGKWVFTLQKPSWIPFLQYDNNRALREKIYRAWFMRGNNDNEFDNKEVVSEMVELRVRKAQLLGYEDYASYIIDENMAKTPEKVDQFLMKLWDASLPVAKREAAEMQKMIDREGEGAKLAPWDWWYYAEKVRKEKYDLDETEMKPYFSLENVRNGMFDVANKLYGITFLKHTDLPVYQEDVEVYEVREADSALTGILYLDYFPRNGKRGGAWCTSFRDAGWENGKRVEPVISIVCNFTPPTGDSPSLLTWDETLTLFHEFGHALHGLFTEGKYNRTAGSVARDYVELPSQIMENWAAAPEVIKSYAKHYQTGEVIPDGLVQKITNSGHFNQGFETVEYVAASVLDMDYHELKEPVKVDVLAFEKEAMDNISLISEIIPRYRSTYFAHIFDGGYAAGYYVYIWAAVLDTDAFSAFKESGDLYNKELAAKFRKYCLAESGDDEGMVQYVKFRGQEPSIDPLLEKRGLK